MARKAKQEIVINKGKGYMPYRLGCATVGMHWLVPFADGLELARWDDEEDAYFSFETLAEWAEKESRHCAGESKKFRELAAAYCRQAAAEVASGKTTITAPGNDYVLAMVEWLEKDCKDKKTANKVKRNRADLFKPQSRNAKEAAKQ